MQTYRKSGVRAATIAAAVWMTAAACVADIGEEPAVETIRSAVTTADVDLAPECAGILTYVNTATALELASALPQSVADAVVARRAVRLFDSLADVSSVPGIAQARLALLYQRALDVGAVDADCVGVYDELGVSASDRVAILAYANSAPQDELEDVARSQRVTTAAAIVAGRPYTHLQQLANVSGVGPDTFRSIRDAAIDTPFDLLADVVNGITGPGAYARISTAFDAFTVGAQGQGIGNLSYAECFGVSQAFVDNLGGTLRPNLADSAEVVEAATWAVTYADFFGNVGDPAPGLADLAARTAGRTFYGCYLNYKTGPWGGFNLAFFVDTQTGSRLLTHIRWVE